MYDLNNNLMFGSDLARRYIFIIMHWYSIIGLGILTMGYSIIKEYMIEITKQQNWKSSEMSVCYDI